MRYRAALATYTITIACTARAPIQAAAWAGSSTRYTQEKTLGNLGFGTFKQNKRHIYWLLPPKNNNATTNNSAFETKQPERQNEPCEASTTQRGVFFTFSHVPPACLSLCFTIYLFHAL